MAKFYVETYRPAFPERGIRLQVHKAKNFFVDGLSPCMTAVFEVDNVKTKAEAVALCIEKLAGNNVCVYRKF